MLVESDHEPLQAIYQKSILSAPMKLQKILLNLQRYDLEFIYKPGSDLHVAGTLSRAYLQDGVPATTFEFEVMGINASDQFSPTALDKLNEEVGSEPSMQRLRKAMEHGWSNHLKRCASRTLEILQYATWVAHWQQFSDERRQTCGATVSTSRICS